MTTGEYGPSLPVSIEDAEALPTAEIALRILQYAQTPLGQWAGNRLDLGTHTVLMGKGEIDREQAIQLSFKLVEAWDWLHQRGLVAVYPGSDNVGSPPRWYVTERGAEVGEDTRAIARLQAEERLGVDLHPLIAGRIRSQYGLGEYEAAAFLAMREVEIRVRALAQLPDLLGTDLMKQSFRKDGGPLADPTQDGGEQEATMALFWGAIGVFKNPSSHREVNYDDPTVAAEIVLFADLLLRLLDAMAPKVAFRRAEQKVSERRDAITTGLQDLVDIYNRTESSKSDSANP